MCGIVGYLSAEQSSADEFCDSARRMADRLAHRGPDEEGFWCDRDAGIAMGHRRLSVLDLTPAGSQPMISPSGRYVIAFNGEAYNDPELRPLLNSSFSWRGHSGTETLLAGFDEWGIERTLVKQVGTCAADWFLQYFDCGDRIHVVPSGVDVEFFNVGSRTESSEALGLPPHAFVIASLGSRNANKGGDRVVAACASVPNAIPVMVGPGWSNARSARFLGLGEVSPAEVRTVLHASDVFVLPSLSEGMPNSLLEALACGFPCVVSTRPFAGFLQDEQNCLKVDPTSQTEIRNAIERLRTSPELRRRLREGARDVATSLSLDRRVAVLEGLLEEAMARRSGRPRATR